MGDLFTPRAGIVVRIPGEPFAQPRPRTRVMGRHAVIYDEPEAAAWKEDARATMRIVLQGSGFSLPFAAAGAVELQLVAVFTCPKSKHRVGTPAERRPHEVSPDTDNLAKAVMDAGNGVLWRDDGQVARLWVEKLVGAQGEEPYMQLRVTPIA